MKITVLVDNSPCSSELELQTEHGLSLYIEHNNQKILCDMGATGVFADNAKALGIDMASCDFAFISHGHNDHCGGLEYFLENTTSKKVYIHSSIANEEYFSTRRGELRNLCCNHRLFDEYRERFNYIETTTQIGKGVFAVQCNTRKEPMPYGNIFLLKKAGEKEENDTFHHELSLVFVTAKGLIIFSPCSHCGALNIISECQTITGCEKVYAYIGGLHFVESDYCISEATDFANTIKSRFPDTMVFTGHCTCDTAKEILKKTSNMIDFFATGCVIEL